MPLEGAWGRLPATRLQQGSQPFCLSFPVCQMEGAGGQNKPLCG